MAKEQTKVVVQMKPDDAAQKAQNVVTEIAKTYKVNQRLNPQFKDKSPIRQPAHEEGLAQEYMVPPPRRVLREDTPIHVVQPITENIQSFVQNPARNEIHGDPKHQPFVQKSSVPQNLDMTVELASYSEQILGDIRDIAPGIPNQDDVLHKRQFKPQLQQSSQFQTLPQPVGNPMVNLQGGYPYQGAPF